MIIISNQVIELIWNIVKPYFWFKSGLQIECLTSWCIFIVAYLHNRVHLHAHCTIIPDPRIITLMPIASFPHIALVTLQPRH